MQKQRLRIAYLSGPVDAVSVYKCWASGEQLGYFGASHLTDFFRLCSELGADGYVITTLSGEYSRERMGEFLIENRPLPRQINTNGILYHGASALWLIRLIPAVIRFRSNIFVITAARNYWFLLFGLKLLGMVIVPACACTLWPKYSKVRASWRILLCLNGIFLSHCVAAVTAMSEDIARQVRSLVRGKKIPIAIFLPIYPRSQFSMFRPADFHARPFQVFFAGRIEANKGVYDLVQIAQIVNRQQPLGFHFHICGDGSELESLNQRIAGLGLSKVITCHGFCERSKLSSLLQESHVAIVPTTTQFEEGFNMVCAESVLAGRPVVTSAVCPALEYLRDAAVEVPPDDVPAYCQALLTLANDYELYMRKITACGPLQEQFYHVDNGWGAKLREVLGPHLANRN